MTDSLVGHSGVFRTSISSASKLCCIFIFSPRICPRSRRRGRRTTTQKPRNLPQIGSQLILLERDTFFKAAVTKEVTFLQLLLLLLPSENCFFCPPPEMTFWLEIEKKIFLPCMKKEKLTVFVQGNFLRTRGEKFSPGLLRC